jgi:hypothetical protein
MCKTCQQELPDFIPVSDDQVEPFIKERHALAKSLGFKGEKEIYYYILSTWITEKESPDWVIEKFETIRNVGSPLEDSIELFEAACELTGMNPI